KCCAVRMNTRQVQPSIDVDEGRPPTVASTNARVALAVTIPETIAVDAADHNLHYPVSTIGGHAGNRCIAPTGGIRDYATAIDKELLPLQASARYHRYSEP